MKTMKKALSVFLVVALLACLGMTGYAAGETITAAAVGTYAESDAAQDVTIRISITGLSEPYCGFYIDDGITLPDGWTLKSYSTSYTAQAVGAADFNTANGSLNYATDDLSDSIPVDTYYEAVVTAPANASGDFSIVFKGVKCGKTYGSVILVSADAVTANVTITAKAPAAEGYTVTAAADKTDAVVGDTVNITLDVTNSDSAKTTFNAFNGTLTYNTAVFTYSASGSTLGDFTVTDNSGTLTITRYGSNISIPGSGAELTLAFTAAAEGTGTFTLSGVKVSEADNANTDAAAATVSGTPSVTVSQTYTVTFAGGNGATGTAPTQDPVTAGTPITLPANPFTKEGFTFAGWLCSVDSVTYDAGASYTMTAAETTFTAQWTAIPTYAVNFDINGATGTAPTMAAQAEGKTFTLPDDTGFTKEGYNFAGWKCSVDGVTYNAGASYTMTAAATTFTAQWTEKAATATAGIVSGYLDGYTLIKVTTENTTKAPTYDGNVMYKLTGDAYDADAYYYAVSGTVSAETAQSKLGWSDTAATTLTKTGDANQTGLIDINDAQFIYNLYNGVTVSYIPTAAQLLASDVNNDGKVDTLDCAAAIAAIQ